MTTVLLGVIAGALALNCVLRAGEELMTYLQYREYRRLYPLGYSYPVWRDAHKKGRR